ncbi:MAG: EamA family transporter [Bacillota bacterium]
MGELLALFSALCFALAGIAVRRGAEEMDRDAGHLLSVLVNAVLNSMALAARVAFGPPLAMSAPGLAYFVAGGVFTAFLGRILWIRSIQRIGPARAGSYKMAQVVLVLLAGVLLLGESASWIGLAGAALVLAGLIALSVEQVKGSGGPGSRTGVWYGLASALSFTVGNLARKSGMLVWPEAFAGAAIGAVVAAILTLGMPGAVPRLREALGRPGGQHGTLWFLGTGVATSISQFSLFAAMGISPIWVVNLLAGTEPMIAALLSLVLLRGREIFGLRLWTSVGLVTAGIVVMSLR